MVDGSLHYDTKIDTSGFEQDAEKITSDAKKIANEVESTVEEASTATTESVSEAANEIQQRIDEILNDTEKSTKGKAASIAQVFIKSGMSSSEAFTKAWDAVGRTGTDPLKNVSSSSKKNSAEIKKSWFGLFNGIKSESGRVAKSAKADFGQMTSAMASSLSKLQRIVLSTFSLTALTAFAKQALETAASVNAANSSMSQTFGVLESSAHAAINRVADESGILETRLRSTATGIYAFAKTSGMDSASALGMMEDALRVAADSAAYYDRSLEDTSETLKSFLKGNYANDAALGLSATEYTRNAAAMKLYGKSFQKLSEAQKQLTLLQMVKDANDLSGATGQAAREADGWENVIGNLKEAWKQLLAVIGQPVLKLAVPVVQAMTSALARLTDYANAAWQALSKVMGWEQVDAISAAADSEKELTKAVEATAEAQEGALAGFDEIQTLTDKSASDSAASSASSGATENAGGQTQAISGVLKPEIDTSALEAGIEKIRSVFTSLAGWFRTTIKPIFSDMFSDIGDATAPLVSWFQSELPDVAERVSSSVGSIFSGMFDSVSMIFSDLWEIVIIPFLESFSSMLPTFASVGEECVKTFATAFGAIKPTFDKIWSEGISPFLKNLMKYWTEALESVKSAWKAHGTPIFEGIRTAFVNMGNSLKMTWESLIKPIWDNFMLIIDSLWTNHIKPLWDKLLDFIGNLIENVLIIYNQVIVPIAQKIAEYLYPIIVEVVTSIQNVVAAAYAFIADIISAVIDIADGLVKYITGVFTGDIEKAFEGLDQMVKGFVNGIITLFEGMVNLVISLVNGLIKAVCSGVNAIISALNSISVDIPEWVPFFGGRHFGINLSYVSPPQIPKLAIPRLASGAVIPPNKEFLAVLGDQKQGTNIEAPLETIKQAFREAMQEAGTSRQATVILQVGRRELGRTIVELGREEEQRVGMRIR